MPDIIGDLLDTGASKVVDAAQKSGAAPLKTLGDIASGAVKGMAISTAIAEGVTWGSLGVAATIAAAAPTTAGMAAAGTAIGVGAAIGNAIPIPGLGAAIGAIVGALVALANAFKGPDFYYVARTPKDAKLLLELIRISPTFLPHLMATLVLEGEAQDPAALANKSTMFWQGKRDPVLVDLAKQMGGLRGDVSAKRFDEMSLYAVLKALKLLAREGPGIKFKGPVIYPGSYMIIGDPREAFVRGWPDYDAWKENDELALKYLRAQGVWDYQKWSGPGSSPFASLQRSVFGKELKPDPLLDPAYLKSLIVKWSDGVDAAPVVRSGEGAQRVLKVLREHLPSSLAIGRERGEAANLDLRPLQDEIKAVRVLAGETGPDPVLAKIFGDVTVLPSDRVTSTSPNVADKSRSAVAIAGLLGLASLVALLAPSFTPPPRRDA